MWHWAQTLTFFMDGASNACYSVDLKWLSLSWSVYVQCNVARICSGIKRKKRFSGRELFSSVLRGIFSLTYYMDIYMGSAVWWILGIHQGIWNLLSICIGDEEYMLSLENWQRIYQNWSFFLVWCGLSFMWYLVNFWGPSLLTVTHGGFISPLKLRHSTTHTEKWFSMHEHNLINPLNMNASKLLDN